MRLRYLSVLTLFFSMLVQLSLGDERAKDTEAPFTVLGKAAIGAETIAFSPLGGSVACICPNGNVVLVDLSTGLTSTFAGKHSPRDHKDLRRIVFAKDGRRLIAGSQMTLLLIDAVSQRLLKEIVPEEGYQYACFWSTSDITRVAALAFSEREGQLAKLRMFDPRSGEVFLDQEIAFEGRVDGGFSLDGSQFFLVESEARNRQPKGFHWASKDGRSLPDFYMPIERAVYRVYFGPNRMVVTYGYDDIFVFDISKADKVRIDTRIKAPTSGGLHYDVSADGTLFAGRCSFASADGAIYLISLSTGAVVRKITDSGLRSNGAVRLTPDGKSVSAATNSGAIRLWDIASGQIRKTIRVDHRQEYALNYAFSPDSERIAYGGDNIPLRICTLAEEPWTPRTVELPRFPESRRVLECATSLVFSHDHSKLVLTSEYSAKHLVWDIENQKTLGQFGTKSFGKISSMSLCFRRVQPFFTNDEPYAFSFVDILGPENRRAHLHKWDMSTGRIVSSYRLDDVNGAHVAACRVSPDGKRLAIAHSRMIAIYDTTQFRFIKALSTGASIAENGGAELAWAPDGKNIVLAYSAMYSHNMVAFDTMTGRKIELSQRCTIPAMMEFTDANSVWFVAHNGNYQLLDLESRMVSEEVVVNRNHEKNTGNTHIRTVASSLAGRMSALGSSDGHVYVTDLTEGTLLATITGKGRSIKALAFSEDKKWLAVADERDLWLVGLEDIRNTTTERQQHQTAVNGRLSVTEGTAKLGIARIEAESLEFRKTGQYQPEVQHMGLWQANRWSGEKQVLARDCRLGDSLLLSLRIRESGTYRMELFVTRAPDYGNVQVSIDDQVVGRPYSGYAPSVTPFGPVVIGSVTLTEGTHIVALRSVGHDPRSTGYMMGIDRIDLIAVGKDESPALGESNGKVSDRKNVLGLEIGLLDCGALFHRFAIGPSFDIRKDWALRMQLWIDGRRSERQVIFLWGDDRRLHDPICVCVEGNQLSASITDCRNNETQSLCHDLDNGVYGRWLPFAFSYDARTSKIRLFVDGKMVKEETCRVTPALDRPMPILIGGAGEMYGERFLGRVRSLRFSNMDSTEEIQSCTFE
jgi:WD40 repeat protein